MSSALDPVPDEKGEFLGESFDGQPVHTLRTSGNTALKASVKPNPLFIPIRFQGQYEDAETGLFYNWFRYYDPKSVGYLSKDRIGLAGGTRVSAYVSNPLASIDPLGLCCAKRPNMERHGLCGAKGRTLKKNTMIDPSIVNIDDDVAAINALANYKPGQQVTVNGRTYISHNEAHNTGVLFPISGPGLTTLDRGQYNYLKMLVENGGNTQLARADALKNGITTSNLDDVDKLYDGSCR